jgi:hypothetical protein
MFFGRLANTSKINNNYKQMWIYSILDITNIFLAANKSYFKRKNAEFFNHNLENLHRFPNLDQFQSYSCQISDTSSKNVCKNFMLHIFLQNLVDGNLPNTSGGKNGGIYNIMKTKTKVI